MAATNRNLEAQVEAGAFRADLLFRLAVVRIALPALSERPEDLVPLIEAFAARFAARHGRPVRAISAQALRELRERPWPGNVRELRNVLDRAVLLSRGGVVRSCDLGADGTGASLAPGGGGAAGYPPTYSLSGRRGSTHPPGARPHGRPPRRRGPHPRCAPQHDDGEDPGVRHRPGRPGRRLTNVGTVSVVRMHGFRASGGWGGPETGFIPRLSGWHGPCAWRWA